MLWSFIENRIELKTYLYFTDKRNWIVAVFTIVCFGLVIRCNKVKKLPNHFMFLWKYFTVFYSDIFCYWTLKTISTLIHLHRIAWIKFYFNHYKYINRCLIRYFRKNKYFSFLQIHSRISASQKSPHVEDATLVVPYIYIYIYKLQPLGFGGMKQSI